MGWFDHTRGNENLFHLACMVCSCIEDLHSRWCNGSKFLGINFGDANVLNCKTMMHSKSVWRVLVLSAASSNLLCIRKTVISKNTNIAPS